MRGAGGTRDEDEEVGNGEPHDDESVGSSDDSDGFEDMTCFDVRRGDE